MREKPMSENASQPLDTLLQSVRALEPLIHAHVEEAERNRRLSPSVVAALREAELFRMYVPKTLGGLEVPPQVLYRVVEEIARIDGATGWGTFFGAVGGVVWGVFPGCAAGPLLGRAHW